MDPDQEIRAAEQLLAALPQAALVSLRGDRSCQRLADQADVTRQSIFAYEKGLRRPSGGAAYRYARALGLLGDRQAAS